jgi:hypothetical protein
MGPHAKLPVLKTTRLAYMFAFENLGGLVRQAWLWLALLAVWNAVVPDLLDPGTVTVTRASVAFNVVDIAIRIAAGTVTAVAWHRAILLGEPIGWWPRIRRHEWRYLWIWILTGLALALPLVFVFALSMSTLSFITTVSRLFGVTAAIAGVATLWGLASLAAAAIGCRVGLALPAAAIRAPLTLGQSIERTTGNTWRLMICTLLVVGPYYAAWLVGSLITMPITPWLGLIALATAPLSPIIGAAAAGAAGLWVLFGVVLVAGMLSFSFYFLHLRPQAAPAHAAAAAAPAE